MQIHFLSDVLIAVASLDLKVPIVSLYALPDKTGLDQRGFRPRAGLEKMVPSKLRDWWQLRPTNKLQ